MTENEGIIESLAQQSFPYRALAYALERNSTLSNIDRERLLGLIRRAASEMAAFEKLSRIESLRVPQTADGAKRIKAIWDISSVGTYLKEFQDDRWKSTFWAGWTDRRRLNYSAALMRRLTERITGKSYKIPLGNRLTPNQAEELRSDIERFGPYLIYGSTLEQNKDVETALAEQGVVVPRSRVHIIDFPKKPVGVNTIDQMRTFSLPPNLQIQKGDILAIVAHAPHMVRALHIANRSKPFPEGLIIQPHPLPSPPSAGTDFAAQEISGLLYYTFISGDSSEEPYPYQI